MNGCSRCVGRALPSGKSQHSAIKRGTAHGAARGSRDHIKKKDATLWLTPSTYDPHDLLVRLTGSDGQSLEGSSWGGERVTLIFREEWLSSVLVGGRAPRERCRLLRLHFSPAHSPTRRVNYNKSCSARRALAGTGQRSLHPRSSAERSPAPKAAPCP